MVPDSVATGAVASTLVSGEDEEDVTVTEELEYNLESFKQRTEKDAPLESIPNLAPLP